MSADRGAKAAAGRLRTIVDGFFDGSVCISTLRLRFDPKQKRHALWDRAHSSNNFKHAEFPARRHKRSNMVPAYTRGQTAKSILRAWAGVINSHMSMPALRRLREDAGESPPECGQEIILFSKGLTRRNLYIESGIVFLKGGKESPFRLDKIKNLHAAVRSGPVILP